MNALTSSIAKKHWNAWAQLAVWAGTVIGMFLMEPPVLTVSGHSGTDLVRFAQFVFAILVGVAFQSSGGRAGDKHRLRAVALALTSFATALFFAYQFAEDSWTCPYAVHWRVVKSQNYTADAKGVAEKLPGRGMSCSEVLKEYGGSAELVWEQSQARRRYLTLNLLYLGLWISSALALVTAIRSRIAPARRQAATVSDEKNR